MTRTALFVLAFSLAFVASAQTAPDPAPPAPAPAPAPDTVTPAPGPEADAAKAATASKAIADRNCLKYTGSRITPRADKQGRKCISASGRGYSREDIDRTGATDIGTALRMLDTAVH